MALTDTAFIVSIFTSHILLLLSAYNVSPPSTNECRELCKLRRPNGSTEAYDIICKDLSKKELYGCEQSCKHCQEICSQQAIPWKIKCPSIVLTDGPCKRRCDYQRRDDFLEEFSFSCRDNQVFPRPWDRLHCVKDCVTCPISICDSHTKTFECPKVETFPERPPPPPTEPSYEGRCEYHCDKNRPPPKVSNKRSFAINRKYEHGSYDDDLDDRDDDGDDGDVTAFDRTAGDNYIDNQDSYNFTCSKVYKQRQEQLELCYADCAKCPLEVCNAFTNHTKGAFHCPNSKSIPPPGPAEPEKFIASWTIIAMIAVGVVGCICATTFYGRSSDVPCCKMFKKCKLKLSSSRNATTTI